MAGMEALLQDEAAVFFIKVGIVLWSLLCVMAAMRNNGQVLKNLAMMLACQFFLVMVGLLVITITQTILSRMIGMAIFAIAIISSIVRKEKFMYARYCIVIGSLLAAFTLLLF